MARQDGKTAKMRSSPSAAKLSGRGSESVSKTTTEPVREAASAPKAPPRKGTFAEIMARSAAGKAGVAPVGVIKHKPVERLTHREQRARKMMRKSKGKRGSSPPRSSPSEGRKGASDHKSGSKATTSKTAKDGTGKPNAPEPGGRRLPRTISTYKGTARPTPKPGSKHKGAAASTSTYRGTAAPKSSYKGTARPANGAFASSDSRPGPPPSTRISSTKSKQNAAVHRRQRYASYSDDEEDEEEGDDVDSDASSDMEAAAHEVEEEEEEALLSAKREDARAQREEEEHQRLKRERRLKMMAAAKKGR